MNKNEVQSPKQTIFRRVSC